MYKSVPVMSYSKKPPIKNYRQCIWPTNRNNIHHPPIKLPADQCSCKPTYKVGSKNKTDKNKQDRLISIHKHRRFCFLDSFICNGQLATNKQNRTKNRFPRMDRVSLQLLQLKIFNNQMRRDSLRTKWVNIAQHPQTGKPYSSHPEMPLFTLFQLQTPCSAIFVLVEGSSPSSKSTSDYVCWAGGLFNYSHNSADLINETKIFPLI